MALGHSYAILGQDSAGNMRLHNPLRHNVVWDDNTVPPTDQPTPEITVPVAYLMNGMSYAPPSTAG